MRLRTLGGLFLEGADFKRGKPLLLLAYLALHGLQSRRELAELFWADAENHMNSLATALSQLRRGASGAVQANETHAWTNIACDAVELHDALKAGRLEEVITLYAGSFALGLDFELGRELEEWVYQQREELATQVQNALLQSAERQASSGNFAEAGQFAERAYRLPGATALAPEVIQRILTLLRAAEYALPSELAKEAEGLGVNLGFSRDEARGRLRQTFVGRELELEKLLALEPGGWAWVRGGSGIGKTALLHRLERVGGGTYVQARSGLPFATLEPLLGAEVSAGNEGALLRKLSTLEGSWLFDGWERMDTESQALLERLWRLGSNARVVIASRDKAVFKPNVQLELQAFTPEALADLPGAFETTGGMPALVEAWLRHEPLTTALEARLTGLEDASREVHSALALLETPDLGLVRQALELDAASFARVLEQLLAVGLIEPSGLVRGRETVLHALQTRPSLEARLALALARRLDGVAALPLYRQARTLWEPKDYPRLERAYRAWALESLHRGFPGRAAEALADAPPELGLITLRVRALERAGQYREALEALVDQALSPEIQALRSILLWRLGRPLEARQAAESALEGDDQARAEACNTLGSLELSSGQFTQALGHFRRAATLWLATGEQERWAGAMNNQAVARAELGEDVDAAFKDALEAAGNHPVQRARVLLSYGRVHERHGQTDQAQGLYLEAATLAQDAGSLGSAARAWNNLGALHHRLEHLDLARDAYRKSLEFAQRVGERLLVGTVLANLAELDDDRESLKEALRLFEQAGHLAMAERYRKQLGA